MRFLKEKKSIIIIVLIYVVLQVAYNAKLINSYHMQLLLFAGINIIMTVSLNIVNGFTGQFSIGQAGFMAVGGYASAIVTTLIFHTSSWPKYISLPAFIISLIIGGIVAAIVGFLIGLPTLRLKGDYLAIVTLAFGEVVRAIIRLINYVGGPRGLPGIPYYGNLFWVYLFTIIAIFAARNFVNSSFGRACIAIRENEVAAEAMGINTTKFKTIAFTFSAFMAGVSGGLFAHVLRYLQPDNFSFLKSNDYLVYLCAGGLASISGSIVSAGVLTIIPEFLRFLDDWRVVIYGVILVVVMIKKPEGLYGNREFAFLKVKKRLEARNGKPVSTSGNS